MTTAVSLRSSLTFEVRGTQGRPERDEEAGDGEDDAW